MRTLVVVLAAMLVIALAAGSASAQFAFPSPDQPDRTVDAATRARIVDSLVVALNDHYVFPEVARSTGRAIRARLKRGDYDRIDSAREFADSLSSHLRAIGKDRHFRVLYYDKPLPHIAAGDDSPPAEEAARILAQWRVRNFGFEKLERLNGNVGYLELRGFSGEPQAGEIAAAAMRFLSNTDALIIDLRRNGGGDPNMIVLMLSYLYGTGERVHVNDFYFREGDRTEQYWTLPSVPGPRYPDKDVFVLTSRRTGSAAEEFSYDIQNLKRGTLVGETTAGAAHPGSLQRLDDHFACFISDGRAINPVSKTNWEGVGVKPDIAVPAEEALKTAHLAALARLIEKSADPERRKILERAVEETRNAPVEPLQPAAPRKTATTGS